MPRACAASEGNRAPPSTSRIVAASRFASRVPSAIRGPFGPFFAVFFRVSFQACGYCVHGRAGAEERVQVGAQSESRTAGAQSGSGLGNAGTGEAETEDVQC